MIEINKYEDKFIQILQNDISLEEFENWLYNCKHEIDLNLKSDIYNELILLNYKTQESKHELAKTLEIDFEKLELYVIQQSIKIELENNPILNGVNYDIDLYELEYISIDFKIGNLIFRMHNPFKIENFVDLSKSEREKIFLCKFGNEIEFLKSILDSIGTKYFRIYNSKKYEQTDRMTDTKIMQTKKDEYRILINSHFCHINKNYIKQRMKKAWL